MDEEGVGGDGVVRGDNCGALHGDVFAAFPFESKPDEGIDAADADECVHERVWEWAGRELFVEADDAAEDEDGAEDVETIYDEDVCVGELPDDKVDGDVGECVEHGVNAHDSATDVVGCDGLEHGHHGDDGHIAEEAHAECHGECDGDGGRECEEDGAESCEDEAAEKNDVGFVAGTNPCDSACTSEHAESDGGGEVGIDLLLLLRGHVGSNKPEARFGERDDRVVDDHGGGPDDHVEDDEEEDFVVSGNVGDALFEGSFAWLVLCVGDGDVWAGLHEGEEGA